MYQTKNILKQILKKKKINKLNKEMQDSRIRHGYKERSDHMICLFPFFKIKSLFF